MKLVQFLLVLFLLPGFPLFQIDQAIDIEWLVCENSLVIKSETNGPSVDQNVCFNPKPPSAFPNQLKAFFQTEDSLSVLLSYFQAASLFSRPPPYSHPFLL